MKIEKLTYTNGEKAAEIAGGVIAMGVIAGLLVMSISGRIDGENIIMAVGAGILYATLTLCSAFPQHTNIAMNPEKISEKNLRAIRRGCLIAKIVLCAALCFLPLIGIEIHN